jgi:hypothetical protein
MCLTIYPFSCIPSLSDNSKSMLLRARYPWHPFCFPIGHNSPAPIKRRFTLSKLAIRRYFHDKPPLFTIRMYFDIIICEAYRTGSERCMAGNEVAGCVLSYIKLGELQGSVTVTGTSSRYGKMFAYPASRVVDVLPQRPGVIVWMKKGPLHEYQEPVVDDT